MTYNVPSCTTEGPQVFTVGPKNWVKDGGGPWTCSLSLFLCSHGQCILAISSPWPSLRFRWDLLACVCLFCLAPSENKHLANVLLTALSRLQKIHGHIINCHLVLNLLYGLLFDPRIIGNTGIFPIHIRLHQVPHVKSLAWSSLGHNGKGLKCKMENRPTVYTS